MAHNPQDNTKRLLAYQHRPTTVVELRQQLTERLERSYASEPDWDDEPCPPTTRTGETPVRQCNEVACIHYAHCDRVPSGECFEVRPNSHLVTLATRALTVDDPELRRLASVLISHPQGNRIAQTALELSELNRR
jgi:hypothetical protein